MTVKHIDEETKGKVASAGKLAIFISASTTWELGYFSRSSPYTYSYMLFLLSKLL